MARIRKKTKVTFIKCFAQTTYSITIEGMKLAFSPAEEDSKILF